MRAHAITTTARVGARAFTRRTTAPRGILALSLAVALFAATASTASASIHLTEPNPFDFGDRQVGTTSPAQQFLLLVTQGDTLNPKISVSGDYAQTNTCPPTLSDPPGTAAAGCLITVTFTPTGTGPRHGTLSTGPGGPTKALTGNGVTTPTPWAGPLTLAVAFKDGYNPDYPGYPVGPAPNGVVRNPLPLTKKLSFKATTSNDSTLVASGDVKRTTKQLAAGEGTAMKAKLKQSKWKQLKEEVQAPKPVRLRAKIKVKATDEFGRTASDEFKLKFVH